MSGVDALAWTAGGVGAALAVANLVANLRRIDREYAAEKRRLAVEWCKMIHRHDQEEAAMRDYIKALDLEARS